MSTITLESGGKLTDVPSIVTQLELLAAVCRDNGVEAEYMALSWTNGKMLVRLTDDDFKRLFAGEKVTGTRSGGTTTVQFDKYGVTWRTFLYERVDNSVLEVEVQL